MIELEINGKKVEVPEGSMVMEAAEKLGVYVPHFCFHKKLSIAANCRMCLVEIEKMGKPLPACATPVNEGMKVFTNTQKAKKAQEAVMEFLLINHPLDCPICDQGGECQLQDLAVGYGGSNSRFTEEKRVVFQKNIGPLISAQEMSRCIHCTRCVRFGQEIAGVMELGMPGRGEHAEISTFLGSAVESELSGNMIDICPVGALTSKPFRYTARTWELQRYKTISPHDGMGTNIIAQVNSGKVARVVPFENETINECWISDRDRFSYSALNSNDRLHEPMIKDKTGDWRPAGWREALEFAVKIISNGKKKGKFGVRGLASPSSSTEEFQLFSKLIKNIGSDSLDFRTWISDKNFDDNVFGIPNLGIKIRELSEISSVFIIGSRFRDDYPLLAQKFRVASRLGDTKIAQLNAIEQDLLMPLEESIIDRPSNWHNQLKDILNVCKNILSCNSNDEKKVSCSESAKRIAKMLIEDISGSPSTLIIAGPSVMSHPQASYLLSIISEISEVISCKFASLPPGGNNTGGYVAEAYPNSDGYNYPSMFVDSEAAFLLLNIEPSKDLKNGLNACECMKNSPYGVIAMTAFKSAVSDVASVMLPISPFTESAGTFINIEGRSQKTRAVANPQGNSRPAWKVLRVIGNLLGIDEFQYQDLTDVENIFSNKIDHKLFVKDQFFEIKKIDYQKLSPVVTDDFFELVSFYPIYLTDQIVRRSESLLNTSQSSTQKLLVNSENFEDLSLNKAKLLKLKDHNGNYLKLDPDTPIIVHPGVAKGSIAVTLGHPNQDNIFSSDNLVKVVVS